MSQETKVDEFTDSLPFELPSSVIKTEEPPSKTEVWENK
jgi:hypothetical protein